MKKSVWILALGVLLAWQGMSYATTTVDALVQKLVEKGILTDKEAVQLKGEIASEEKKSQETGFKTQLPDWVQNIKLSGDFRLRDQYQRRFIPGATGSAKNHLAQNRGRFRARLNVEDQINDKIKVVFGLATEGGKDNGSLANSRSNNVTFGGNSGGVGDNNGTFSKPYVAINKAYAVYTPNQYITLTGGKMDNPIWEPASLLWDPDITPEGGAIQLQKKINDYLTPFSTNAFFDLKSITPDTTTVSAKTDPYMFVSQEGIKGNLTEKVYYKAAGSYYNIINTNHLQLDNRPSAPNNMNTVSPCPGSSSAYCYQYSYNLIGASAELGMNDPLGELLPSPLYIPQVGAFGQYFKNMNPSHQNSAWQIGGYIGNSSINGWGTWKLQSFYKVLERDSWLDSLPDDDFYSGATNTKGWRSQLDIGLAKNTWFTVSYFHTNRFKNINTFSNAGTSDSAYSTSAVENLIQADLNFKF